MQDTYFEINNLTHQFADGTIALNNVSLSIKKGKKIALLGNNGAGKSTLLLHLNGILQPTTGYLTFMDQKMSYKRKDLLRIRSNVNIVFQDPDSQLVSSSVLQDISFGPLNLGMSEQEVRQQVDWAIQKLEIQHLLHKPVHFLSLGQKKRVAIAGILAMNPKVFILDEPTAGLDAYYSNQIIDILNQLGQQDRTIILSTHDVDLAFEWADEIITMNDGQVTYTGDYMKVFQNEEIMKNAHLNKPWVLSTFEQLKKLSLLNDDIPVPRNKTELFTALSNISPASAIQ